MSHTTQEQVHYRGRNGEALTLGEFARLYADREYRLVAKAEHLDAVVQTQWEGIDDGVQVGCVWHTGICWAGAWTTVWEGYWPTTEDEAKAKHEEIVTLLRETCPEQPAAGRRAEFQRRLRLVQSAVTPAST